MHPDDRMQDAGLSPTRYKAYNPDDRTHSGPADGGKDLRTLSDRHRDVLYEEIARRIIERHSSSRICHDLAISSSTLTRILRSSHFDTVFNRVHKRILEPIESAMRDERMNLNDRLTYGAQRALTRLFKLLESAESENVRLRAATATLDRAGFGPVTHTTSQRTDTLTIDPDTASAIASALTAGVRRADVVDVTPSDASEASDTPTAPETPPDASERLSDAPEPPSDPTQ